MMNRMTPDQERAPASEPVWERPWSVEEIRRSSQSWSLAADAGEHTPVLAPENASLAAPGHRGEGRTRTAAQTRHSLHWCFWQCRSAPSRGEIRFPYAERLLGH
ncbi:uncharacterized protein LOC103796645 [Callithrix jacchus]